MRLVEDWEKSLTPGNELGEHVELVLVLRRTCDGGDVHNCFSANRRWCEAESTKDTDGCLLILLESGDKMYRLSLCTNTVSMI